MSELSEFDRNGYAIVRGFLDDETCDKFLAEFEAQPGVENRNYIARPVGQEGLERFYPIFMEKGQEILKDSVYGTDMLAWGDYFSIKDGVDAKWHLDHETYFLWQDHFRSYNFYIPIVKPDPKKSNLSVIPVSRLTEEMPELGHDLLGKGARMMIEVDGEWVVYDEENCRVTTKVEPEIIDKMCLTPELAKGDLLLARGDVFHKTQDTTTRRVALSVRAISSTSLVKKSTLISGGASKLCYLTEGRQAYNMLLDMYEVLGTDEIEARVVSGALRALKSGNKPIPSEEEFIKRVVALRTPLERKKLRLQAESLMSYEKREHFVRFSSIIAKEA